MCKVSIVIPYYNNQSTIIRALESVVNQTYKNYEVILINDGSTDKTLEIVEQYILAHKDVRILNLVQKNNGPAAARNNGVKNSKGDYIAFLDSDDSWDKHKLEKQMNFIKKNNIDLLGSNHKIIKDDKIYNNCFVKKKTRKIGFYSLLFKHYFYPSCTIVKKSTLLLVGCFPEGQRYMEDSLAFTRIARVGSVYVMKDLLATSYKLPYGDNGLSANLKKMEEYELYNFKTLRKENFQSSKKINILLYLVIVLFSLLKYFKRIIRCL